MRTNPFIYFALVILTSCTSITQKELPAEAAPDSSVINSTSNTEVKDGWDDNIYTNNYHKFKIEFPLDWLQQKEEHDGTLAKMYNKETGAGFYIEVSLPLPKKFGDSSDIQKSLSKSDIRTLLIVGSSQKFEAISNIKITDSYLDNYKAYTISFDYIGMFQNESVKYNGFLVKSLKNGKLYQVTFLIPSAKFDKQNKSILSKVISSFSFIS